MPFPVTTSLVNPNEIASNADFLGYPGHGPAPGPCPVQIHLVSPGPAPDRIHLACPSPGPGFGLIHLASAVHG